MDPAVLFFVFGLVAGGLRSNLEIPAPISRFLSLYLLMALGLKGGFALARSGLNAEVMAGLACAVALALVVPALGFWVLRRWLNGYDAAAVAATYGSVSAVTFITATQYLTHQGIAYGGHMAAAMALMESPAIILAVLWANRLRRSQDGAGPGLSWSKVLHESVTDGAQLLLIGAMVIGWITGAEGERALESFSVDLFKGMLCFFLLDMGLLAARNMAQLRGQSLALVGYAIAAPVLHASLALALATLVGLSLGDSILLMVLAASASYIAVPAVVRHAIPEARPSLYFGMSLGITFPLNILVGIPVYAWAAARLTG